MTRCATITFIVDLGTIPSEEKRVVATVSALRLGVERLVNHLLAGNYDLAGGEAVLVMGGTVQAKWKMTADGAAEPAK